MEKELVILKKHNGEFQNYHIISEKKLKLWISDGSIQDGDMVGYLSNLKIAKEEVQSKLTLKSLYPKTYTASDKEDLK